MDPSCGEGVARLHHCSLYTATSALLWLALGVLCVLAKEDERINRVDKRRHYLTYGIIALALLSEWAGVTLSAIPGVPAWAIRLVKCCDYTLTPMAGGAITAQMGIRNRWSTAIVHTLRLNAVIQVISMFTGWMVVVNESVGYSHGMLYPLYAAIYVLILVCVIVQFRIYGMSFHRENRLSLYTSASLVVIGILMQELLGSEIRTAYIGLTLGAALLYIHSTEFSQQRADDKLRKQQRQITTDALTGTRSRHAYARVLDAFSQEDSLPSNLAVFSIDANGLKEVNDTFGHDAGDVLLCGAAECIMDVFTGHGSCYRIGGDEFVVIAHMTREQADDALARLAERTGDWRSGEIDGISLSAGYALSSEHPGCTCDELVGIADEAMYATKAEYYRREGKNRRSHHETPAKDAITTDMVGDGADRSDGANGQDEATG